MTREENVQEPAREPGLHASPPEHAEHERRREHDRRHEQATLAELLQRLSRDATTIVRDEVELVRAETRESIERTRASIVQFVSAAIFFLIGGISLAAALIIGLAEFMDEWIAALAVGLIALIIGWALRSRASSNLSARALKPSRTTHSLRRDRDMLKEKLS